MFVAGLKTTLDVSLIDWTVKQIDQILYDDSSDDSVYLFYLGFSKIFFFNYCNIRQFEIRKVLIDFVYWQLLIICKEILSRELNVLNITH